MSWNCVIPNLPFRKSGGGITFTNDGELALVTRRDGKSTLNEGVYICRNNEWLITSFPHSYPIQLNDAKVLNHERQNKLYYYSGFDEVNCFDIPSETYSSINIKPAPHYKRTNLQNLCAIEKDNIHVITSYPNQSSSTPPNICTHLIIDTITRSKHVLTQCDELSAFRFMEHSQKHDAIIIIGTSIKIFDIQRKEWRSEERIKFNMIPMDVVMSVHGDILVVLLKNSDKRWGKHILTYIHINKNGDLSLSSNTLTTPIGTGNILLKYDKERSVMLTRGFIAMCWRNDTFASLRELPVYLCDLISTWVVVEELHYINTDLTSKLNRRKHHYIALDELVH